jgi:hypothetical protein
VAETFSGGVFFIFLTDALFIWRGLFCFSESEYAQGLMPFADLPGIFRVTP